MKKSLTYILSIAALFILHSCGMEEINVPEPGTSNAGTIEFVAMPTYYDEFNVATKVTSSEITDLENKIYTAFFMLYDNDGNRVIFHDLTSTATSGGSISHTVVSDKGLSSATACFLANVSTEYAKSLTTVADLKGDKPLNIEYASITSECIGIPLLTDASKRLDKVYSIPMAGVTQRDLSALGEFNNSIQIPLERLFAKIIVKLSVNILDENPNDNNVPQFTLSNFVVNNMPNKVAIIAPDNDPPATLWATSSDAADYLVTDNWMSNFNLDNGADDSETVTTGQGTKSLFFYVPEHLVPRDRENTMVENEELRQQQKPLLIDSDKKAIYVSIKGNLNVPGTSPMIADYNIYLGENSWDDFNIKRNKIYTNNITINGAEADNRVEFIHGDVSVLFKRATYLDSHFEVRPLRVKWTGEGTAAGTVTVKVMHAYDDEAAAPDWVRLERPSDSERKTDSYCGTIGKRKYFTTDLVQNTLKNNTSLNFQISDDEEGDFPTWVYVDEFTPSGNSFSDEVRQARIRVIFTPADDTRDVLTVDYVITQRSIYPVVGTKQTNHTYGIEYFEEYLYDYDRVDIEDLGDGEYHATQDGMEWGLHGVQLSSEVQSVSIDQDKFNAGLKNAGGNVGTLTKYLGDFVDELSTDIVNNIIDDANIGAVYDFYTSLDTQVPDDKRHNYSGLSFTHKIVSDQQIGTLSLTENPTSAVEYCLNKNKRNPDGSITTIHWYLPAIDELEDIVESAYNEFDVFQNRLYWSSQPAYYPNHILYDADIELKIISSIFLRGYYRFDAGSYYEDNLNSARATKVDSDGKSVLSGANGYYKRLHINELKDLSYTLREGVTGTVVYDPPVLVGSSGYTYPSDTHTWTERKSQKSYTEPAFNVTPYTTDGHEGNCLRTGTKNRVRCVYSKDGIAL